MHRCMTLESMITSLERGQVANNVSFLIVAVYKGFFGHYAPFSCAYVVLRVLLPNIDSSFCFANARRLIDAYNAFLKSSLDE